MPIIRVVRFDDSGTSFAFKDYLGTINGGRGWLTTYEDGTAGPASGRAPNSARAASAAAPNGPGKQADTTDHLTSGCANGNGALVAN